MLSVTVLVITCVANLLLGLLVFTRNPKLKLSTSFLLVSIFVSIWAATNYLTSYPDIDISLNRVANSVAFFSAFLAISFGLRFVVNIQEPKYLGFGKIWDRILTGLGISIALLSLTPLVAGKVTQSDDGLHFSVGPFLPVYIFTIVLFIGLIIKTTLRVISSTRGREKQQAALILIGFSVPPFLALIVSAVIPSITKSWESATIGPIFTLLLVGIIAFAIVRHRLFDIRFAAARSMGYLLGLLSVAVLYTVITFGIVFLILGVDVDVMLSIYIVLFSVLTALIFYPMKRFFDRISDRVFYRDAYDAQDLLDRASNLLVGTVDADRIKQRMCLILEDTLQPSSIQFLMKASEQQDTSPYKHLNISDSKLKVIVTDELDRERYRILSEELRKNNVALVLKLSTTHDNLGYLLLGYRKSGTIYTTTDIRLLGLIADELALGLQNALRFQEIQNFNATLQQKVDDATKKLRQSNEKLRILDQTKDDFISMASHQLRTPLTSIKGYISMVLEGDAGKINPVQQKMLQQAFTSSQRMTYLIADLLNMSRLKTGKFVIEAMPTNLATIVEQEVEQLVETAKSRDLTLTYNQPSEFPELMLDETKIRQVIMNFVDNAIYYTPAGGKIEIRLEETPKSVELRVIDNGIGVSKAEQHHLFTKFYRASNAKRARPDGTGLGLFMAKKVVVAQGGALIFDSREGKGSTFGFSFPKKLITAQKQQDIAKV